MLTDADTTPSDAPAPIPPRRTIPTPLRRWEPLAGGLGAIALAGWAEGRVESGDMSNTPLLAYLAAIALFAASAWPLPRAPDEEPAAGPADLPAPGERRVVWLVLALGVGGAVLLNGLALVQLRADIESPNGFWLWLISLVVLLVGGIGVSRRQGWAARWGQAVWPITGAGRALLALAVVAILVGAAAARWIALDRVPFGLNADEGDRAALAIRLMRGTDSSGFFDIGWYYIPMPYFQILAAWMRWLGIGFVQARAFSGLWGLISVAGVTWIGLRHFGVRVGLLAGAILGGLAVALQFSRLTTEANPTTTLWVISAALFLEGARSGRSWTWIGAGLAGGFSLYFYPSGRLWALFAAGWCLYLLLHGLSGRRWGILRGALLAAVAAVLVVGPYFVRIADDLQMFSLRAQQTSIFDPENPKRLSYYDPHWTFPQLLQAQVIHAVGIFNQFGEGGNVWPTDKPLLAGLLAVLTLLGLGWLALRPRDPRFVAPAAWFVSGFVGVIVTVETPNMQRMATAVPVLALAAALTLDSLARRVEAVTVAGTVRLRRALATVSTVAVALVAAGLLVREARFYFVDYAAMDRWTAPTVLGDTVAAQGPDTLVTTVSRFAPMVNAGWVRLLAFDIPRAAIGTPGSHLPLAVPADRNLAFLIYPKQAEYLPYLQTLYPGGTSTPITHTTDGLQFTIYRVPQAAWAATQGA
ncbi:MAG: glycosyltransferase family 39 protein, partial [Chloroflexota bacterium]|nr:glycosyltransferase family 39 protein [Chloroflexota bacterium]